VYDRQKFLHIFPIAPSDDCIVDFEVHMVFPCLSCAFMRRGPPVYCKPNGQIWLLIVITILDMSVQEIFGWTKVSTKDP